MKYFWESQIPESVTRSPSMRREWIEMAFVISNPLQVMSLPPCGGSGLKYLNSTVNESEVECLPPCGGSGLKCCYHFQQYESCCLPPCGGSGLKSHVQRKRQNCKRSPSMRREWIEISIFRAVGSMSSVSLHAEGVD